MSKTKFTRGSAAVLGVVAIGTMSLAMTGVASADTGTSYQANLQQLNNSGASGALMIQLSGNKATITESVSGLAATWIGKPYPHIQNININGTGVCPTPAADTDGNGIVDALEGRPAYGVAGTTLSMTGDTSINASNDVWVAPSGATFQYSRTITLDAATLASLKAGTALIVVHGIDSANLSKSVQDAKSTLAPMLPLAATAPALCGALVASQMQVMPVGAADTGGGSTAGIEDGGLLAVGGGLLLAAAGIGFAGRRRFWQN